MGNFFHMRATFFLMTYDGQLLVKGRYPHFPPEGPLPDCRSTKKPPRYCGGETPGCFRKGERGASGTGLRRRKEAAAGHALGAGLAVDSLQDAFRQKNGGKVTGVIPGKRRLTRARRHRGGKRHGRADRDMGRVLLAAEGEQRCFVKNNTLSPSCWQRRGKRVGWNQTARRP